MTTIKLSEQVRRLEDTIESLRRDNKELRSKVGIVQRKHWIADGTIQDLEKRVTELSRELKARVDQVENLQDTLKKITKENLELQEKNKKLKSKLDQTVDEYDEDYQTFTNNFNDDLSNLAEWKIDVDNFFNKRMR